METASMRIRRLLSEQRPQSLGEEIANSVSHGVGFLLAVAALPVLLRTCAQRGGEPLDFMAVTLFAATMMLLYGVSAVYHALPMGRVKQIFNRFDHAAIYLFIAGSYTPFALGALRGGLGWALFGVVWALAAMGALAKLLNRLSHPLLSTGLYIAMGWLAVFAAGPLLERVAPAGVWLLLAGGVAYTLGAIVFLLDSRVRYAHFVWHLFVMGGSACHFFAALWYAR
ncbi:MAG: hemolysin III family protein [Pseudomonadota bacterium]